MKTLEEFLYKKPQIEIDNLKSSTELNLKMFRRLKYETHRNILFLIIGALITLATSKLSSLNTQEKKILDNKKVNELYRIEKLNQIHLQEMQLEINELKKTYINTVDFDRKF